MILLYSTAIFVVFLCLVWYYFDQKRGRVLESRSYKSEPKVVEDKNTINAGVDGSDHDSEF